MRLLPAPMSLSRFVLEVTGHALGELVPEDAAALTTIYGWGAGPDQVRGYLEKHGVSGWPELVLFIERRVK